MKFAAAGDAIIQRRIQKKFEGYEELSPYISDSDASFSILKQHLTTRASATALSSAEELT